MNRPHEDPNCNCKACEAYGNGEPKDDLTFLRRGDAYEAHLIVENPSYTLIARWENEQ